MKRYAMITASLALSVLCGCRENKPAVSDLLNTDATLKGQLPYAVLQWKPLTVSIDRTLGTTSTLFSDGRTLALVTWNEREDPHWFGARIPGAPQRVEIVVEAGDGNTGDGTARYHIYTGSPLIEQSNGADPGSRIAAISAMRPIDLP